MFGWLKRTAVTTLTPQEAHEQASRGEILLVDVREAGEWAQGHIPGAVHMPLSQIAQLIGALPKERPVVFYCLSGARSASAVRYAEQASVPHRAHLGGGITAWRMQGLPVTR